MAKVYGSTIANALNSAIFSHNFGWIFFLLIITAGAFLLIMHQNLKSHVEHKSYTFSEIKQKMAAYCTYQDRCHQEVEQKMRDFLLNPEGR